MPELHGDELGRRVGAERNDAGANRCDDDGGGGGGPERSAPPRSELLRDRVQPVLHAVGDPYVDERVRQFAVELVEGRIGIGQRVRQRIGACVVGHRLLPPTRAEASGRSVSRKAARARCRRESTVPTGTSRAAAHSLVLRPSTKTMRNGILKRSSSASRARCSSSPVPDRHVRVDANAVPDIAAHGPAGDGRGRARDARTESGESGTTRPAPSRAHAGRGGRAMLPHRFPAQGPPPGGRPRIVESQNGTSRARSYGQAARRAHAPTRAWFHWPRAYPKRAQATSNYSGPNFGNLADPQGH